MDCITLCTEMLSIAIKDNILGLVEYMKRTCSARDFLCITDMLDEIFTAVKFQDLVDAFRYATTTCFQQEDAQYSITKDIEEAAENYGDGIIL